LSSCCAARGEVVSKREILELLHGRLRPGSAGAKLDHSLADAGQVGAELHEHLGGDALTLADQPEQQVLGADVVVVELERLTKDDMYRDPLRRKHDDSC